MAGTSTRPVKSAAVAAANYGTAGGSSAAGAAWAAGFLADPAAIFAAAADSVDEWQAAVNTQQAADNFVAGLGKVNIAAVTKKVNGVGKSSFTAGVNAAAGPGGNYMAFSSAFQPWMTTELANLNRTNPRGDKSANRARLNTFLDDLEAKAGTFRVK